MKKLMHDIAKPGAVKIGPAPFNKAMSGTQGKASHSAAHKGPGGKLSPKKLAGVGK